MTNQGGRLQAGPGGSQTFIPPAIYNGAPGDLSLVRGGNNVALPSVKPLGAPRIYGPTAVDSKNAPGLYWVRLEWNDLRGGFAQYGDMYEVMHSSSLCELVPDDRGIARHPFLTSSQTTPDPLAVPTRLIHSNCFDTLYIAMSEYASGANIDHIFTETSATDPTIVNLATFARAGTNLGINALRKVKINGVLYLAVCWAAAGGGATSSLQVFSDAALTTSIQVPVGMLATYDVIQVPVYSDALLVLNGTSVLRGSAAATAAGAMTFTTVETVPTGGQWIGVMGAGVGVGTPSVAGIFPVDGNVLLTPRVTSTTGETNKAKLLLFQTSGQILGELTTKTKWVTNATKFAEGLVYCDQETHYYWDGRNHIPMLAAQDRFPDSNYKRVCTSHHVKGDKFFWTENYTKTSAGTGNTQQYRMEYDLYTNTSRQVSTAQDLGTTGVLTLGGGNCPVSEQTDFLHVYANGSWYRQYQSPSSIRGYDQRKTAGAAAGTGQQYEPYPTWVSSAVEITGFETAAKVVARVTGPLSSSVAAGGSGTGGGTPAFLRMNVTGQQAFDLLQTTGRERRLMKEFPMGMDSAFRGPVQLQAQSFQQVGGTDPTRLTTNILPMSVEMFMYQRALEHSPNYAQWDRAGWANG